MSQKVREIAERTTTDFEAWWAFDGRFIDPDTSDVPWFDKRKELAALAFIEARKPVASTEPLGDDMLRAIIYEPGYSVPYDLALRMASDIEKKAAEIGDLQAQLKTAQCSAEDRLQQIRQIAKQSADFRDQLQAAVQEEQRLNDLFDKAHADATIAHRFIESLVGEQARGRDFAVKVPMAEKLIDRQHNWQQLADERGREVERLRVALASITDGVMVATGRLRKGYSQLHPGISNFCDSYGYLVREARSALATPAATPQEHRQQAIRFRVGRKLSTTVYRGEEEQPCAWVPSDSRLAARIVELLNIADDYNPATPPAQEKE